MEHILTLLLYLDQFWNNNFIHYRELRVHICIEYKYEVHIKNIKDEQNFKMTVFGDLIYASVL